MIPILKRPLFAIAVAFLLLPSFAFAAQINVLDYYRIIPSKYFLLDLRDFAGKTPAARDASLKVIPNTGEDDQKPQSLIDFKNGYLRAPTKNSYGDGDEAIIVDIFTYKSENTIGVESHSGGMGKFNSKLVFLKYFKGTWSDVTSKVLPVNFKNMISNHAKMRCQMWAKEIKIQVSSCLSKIDSLTYEMPHKGTTIKVWFNNRPFYKLLWKNGKFVATEWWDPEIYNF